MYDNGCECIEYNCGCCQYLQWDVISMDGKCKYIIICSLYYNYLISLYSVLGLFLYIIVCANASYLEKDDEFLVTITYNDFVVINETISGNI